MSGSLPFGKFFWSDYASDPALKICSFAAQGLWMRMLCIAAEHDPVGYVAVNGRGLDTNTIARATGGSLDEVQELLAELETNGVFSRDRRGWIYSRRMIRDAKKARNAREIGKKGGNPSLRKQKENQGKDNLEDKGSDKSHIPESRDQSSDTNVSGAEAPSEEHEIDPVKAMFDAGIKLLEDSGVPKKQARSLIGKWRGQAGDDEVRLGIAEAQVARVTDPVPYLSKRFAHSRPKQNGSGNFLDYVLEREREQASWGQPAAGAAR